MYTLIVIDMQSDFNSANNRFVIANCKREIRKAIKNKAAIIFLEFAGCGLTHKELTKLVSSYDKTWTSIKHDDNGSYEVECLIYKHKLNKNIIRVCGVNTDCCVKETVYGLTLSFGRASIEIIADACNSDWYHLSGLKSLRKMRNVRVH